MISKGCDEMALLKIKGLTYEVICITEERTAGSRGHIDCMEIIKNTATAVAMIVKGMLK